MNWGFGFLPDATCEYGGITIRELYRDADKYMQGAQRCRERCLELFGHDLTGYALHMPSYERLVPLGATVVYPEYAEPMVVEPVLSNLGDVAGCRVPRSFLETESGKFYVRKRARINSSGDHTVCFPPGIEGPATPAKLIRGQAFFTDLYDDPKGAEALLTFAANIEIAYRKEICELEGWAPGENLCLWDDVAGMLSPDDFGRFVVPHYQRIRDEFQCPVSYFHCEELRLEHLKWLPEFGVQTVDRGWDRYLTTSMLRDNCDMRFTYTFNYMRDLKESTPKRIAACYKEQVEAGGDRLTRIHGQIPAGVPPENIRALLDVAREYE